MKGGKDEQGEGQLEKGSGAVHGGLGAVVGGVGEGTGGLKMKERVKGLRHWRGRKEARDG